MSALVQSKDMSGHMSALVQSTNMSGPLQTFLDPEEILDSGDMYGVVQTYQDPEVDLDYVEMRLAKLAMGEEGGGSDISDGMCREGGNWDTC